MQNYTFYEGNKSKKIIQSCLWKKHKIKFAFYANYILLRQEKINFVNCIRIGLIVPKL